MDIVAVFIAIHIVIQSPQPVGVCTMCLAETTIFGQILSNPKTVWTCFEAITIFLHVIKSGDDDLYVLTPAMENSANCHRLIKILILLVPNYVELHIFGVSLPNNLERYIPFAISCSKLYVSADKAKLRAWCADM